MCSSLIKHPMQRNNKLGALAFGVELPNGKQAYPTSPSWMLYGGDDAHCMDNVPVLIRPETFCSVFTAEARVFRQGHPFLTPVSSHVLWQLLLYMQVGGQHTRNLGYWAHANLIQLAAAAA